ncbi:MAG: glycogen synthase [Bacteroidota bacterium]
MARTINVLFMAAEADPFIKVGGLGDVAGALPRALRSLPPEVTGDSRLDLRLVLPLHSAVRSETLRPLTVFSIPKGDSEIQAEVFESSLDGMPVYFISGAPIRSSGSVYSLRPEPDAEKYVFFSLAAAELPRQLGWNVDILHGNDWHTALALYSNLTRRWEEGARRVSALLTLHNLPFMGPDVSSLMAAYGLPVAQTDLPEWARVLPLPLGLWASDAIVPVSPSYAAELLTPEYGGGLQDFLASRQDSLHGILNGIDTASYNPTDDDALVSPFSLFTLEDRPRNKTALQVRLGFPSLPDVPLLGMVSRMEPQKGIDLAVRALNSLRGQFQAFILGTGEPGLEEAVRSLAAAHPDNIRAEIRFDGQLARQIYAGSDVLLMPSRYEPCGLSQMIAMRYGCVPLVRAVGGLRDTVTEETGFIFQKPLVQSLAAALRGALRLYPERSAWQELQKAGMAKDFSWTRSAREYFALYQSIVHESTPVISSNPL